MHVVMLLYPDMTQLDLTGPFEVLVQFKELSLHLVAKNRDPVIDSGGLRLTPEVTFANCPKADILFVPGGPGQISRLRQPPVKRSDVKLGFIISGTGGKSRRHSMPGPVNKLLSRYAKKLASMTGEFSSRD